MTSKEKSEYPQEKAPLSVIILTFNEEKNIRRNLESVVSWADEIFIVDSGSADATLEIVGEYTKNVFTNPFVNFTKQWIWALENVPHRNDWVLGLDADQSVTPELASEIVSLLKYGADSVNGYYIKRRQYFLGKWIKNGTYYPRYLLKLFRADKVYFDKKERVDHHFYVSAATGKLENDIIEDNKNETLRFWIDKHNGYSTLQAIEEMSRSKTDFDLGDISGNQDQRRRALLNVWYRLPLFLRPLIYFLYRYFIRLGFLDGKEGLVFHFLQGFWYRFLVDSKMYEIRKKMVEEGKTLDQAVEEIYGLVVDDITDW